MAESAVGFRKIMITMVTVPSGVQPISRRDTISNHWHWLVGSMTMNLEKILCIEHDRPDKRPGIEWAPCVGGDCRFQSIRSGGPSEVRSE